MSFDKHATIRKLGPFFAAPAAAHDAEGDFVGGNYASLKELRAFSAMIPENLGGGGLPHMSLHSRDVPQLFVHPIWRSPCTGGRRRLELPPGQPRGEAKAAYAIPGRSGSPVARPQVTS